MGRILTVCYKFSHNGEDYFWCSETKRMYVRQPANVPDFAFWYSTTRWSQGYEADCPLKAGITMQVVTQKGVPLFAETLEADANDVGTYARKVGEFYRDTVHRLADRLAAGLTPYYEWKAWLMTDKEKSGNTDYYDTWLYSLSEVLKTKMIGRRSILGRSVYLAEVRCRHKVSGKKWSEFVVLDNDKETYLAIAGYWLTSEYGKRPVQAESFAMRDTVDFDYNGRLYSMTWDELEAAFRYQDRQYMLEDAARNLEILAFGYTGDPLRTLTEEENLALAAFERDIGTTYAALTECLDEIVDEYSDIHDCNVADNDLWKTAIRNVARRIG